MRGGARAVRSGAIRQTRPCADNGYCYRCEWQRREQTQMATLADHGHVGTAATLLFFYAYSQTRSPIPFGDFSHPPINGRWEPVLDALAS